MFTSVFSKVGAKVLRKFRVFPKSPLALYRASVPAHRNRFTKLRGVQWSIHSWGSSNSARVIKVSARRMYRRCSRPGIDPCQGAEFAVCSPVGVGLILVETFMLVPLCLVLAARGHSAMVLLALLIPPVCMGLVFPCRTDTKNGFFVCASVVSFVLTVVLIHVSLGGLRQSGGVLIWTLIAPPLVGMGHRLATGAVTGGLIAILVAVLAFADSFISGRVRLPDDVQVPLFIFNFAGFGLFIWLAAAFNVWRNGRQRYSITQLAVAQARAQLALVDTLTGMPNRAGVKQLPPASFPLTVLVIDLQRFNAINTVLGRAFGDRVLVLFSERLNSLRLGSLGRLYADRFVMLWAGAPTCGEIDLTIGGVLEAPLEINGQVIDISATIGVARSKTLADLELSMRNAEIALTGARTRYRKCFEYTPALNKHRRSDLSLMSDLNQAISKQELRMFLQPKVRLHDGAVLSAEALMRWENPVRGMVPPMEFIPFAEQTGRFGPLTRWILEEAMRTAVSRRSSEKPMQISVNVCATDLTDPEFYSDVMDLAQRTGVDAGDIRFEVTESGLMERPDLALSVMKRLQSVGFSWSIDDFGTGYSSLSHLQKMPVAELKIDRSFVSGLGSPQHNSKLLRSAIRMGHELGLAVVCEGAETEDEWQGLLELGADYGQGWFAAHPMPASEIDAWCDANAPFKAALKNHVGRKLAAYAVTGKQISNRVSVSPKGARR